MSTHTACQSHCRSWSADRKFPNSCAIGACLADREDAEAPLLDPEFYSARAKALLDIEMDSPTVATVQALVIMSATEAAFTRDARGWLYSGNHPLTSPTGRNVQGDVPLCSEVEADSVGVVGQNRNGGPTECRPWSSSKCY